jgi:hypothetical protein
MINYFAALLCDPGILGSAELNAYELSFCGTSWQGSMDISSGKTHSFEVFEIASLS